MNLSAGLGNALIDFLFRGGALSASGAAGSTAVVNRGIRAANTAYSLGDVVVPNALDTGAGGKFLQCTTPGTSQGTISALAIGNPGTNVVDGAVTWVVVSGMPCKAALYLALFNINKGLRANNTAYSVGDCISLTPTGGANGDTNQHVYSCTTAGTSAGAQPTTYLGVDGEVITDGTAVFTELSPTLKSGSGFPSGLTEVSATGTGYGRVKLSAGSYPALTDFAGTQSSGSTTASTGTSQQTSNNGVISFGTPTANWTASPQMVGVAAIYDQSTGGNLQAAAALNAPKSVSTGDPAPTYSAGALTFNIDN